MAASHAPAKKVSKKEQARLAREGKIAREARAVARVTGATNRKKMALMKERQRLELEAKRGAASRADAMARLELEKGLSGKKKKARTNSVPSAGGGAAGKKKCRISPHMPVEEDDEESADMSDMSAVETPVEPAVPAPQSDITASSAGRTTARTLDLNLLLDSDSSDGGEMAAIDEPAAADNGMTSEVEGDSSDSECWYVEHADDADPYAVQEEAHEVVDEDSSDDELDGEAIAERHRKNAYKRIADTKALQKMRSDGWKLESNRYYHQHLNDRVQGMYQKQRDAGKDMTREQIMDAETRKHKEIKDHWVTSTTGAVPVGTFGRYMSKARFGRIMQNLHFSDNANPRAENDRAWKVRPVDQKLQQTFCAGYKVPPVLAFDEAMIPSRTRHNVTRQYMKDKPHKWGTKLFMTCCANTAYCLRLEVFCGKDQHESELGGGSPSKYSADPNSGPAAVVRNLHELLHRNVYSIGTIQANKAGFPKEVTAEYATHPRDIPRGSTKMAIMKNVPQMTSLLWWDRMPVQFLATGASRTMRTCGKPASSETTPPADHTKFLRLLQAQMLELTASDFANVTLSPAQPTQTDTAARVPLQHKLTTFQAWSFFGKEKEHR
ncbi:Hypothetical protein PHPALM_17990 [Phytophthora palmivora]|uniref:PiggyBac transposable element-derived protein domain-containing protein n=1 Tax=Phytophthora palmivora TaxID=4796 RepID=A0A2P4XKW2_9STRA|nr:Hypothetical protein PHPALM_17990 [Phytophthora palmivora]